MTADACFADAIEQAAVVVGVEVRRRVIDGERADEAIAEDQRRDQRRLQRRLVAGEPGGFEFRARPRVDERPAVARDPAGQALPGAQRHASPIASASTPVAKRQRSVSVFFVEEEQRARRERHEVRSASTR